MQTESPGREFALMTPLRNMFRNMQRSRQRSALAIIIKWRECTTDQWNWHRHGRWQHGTKTATRCVTDGRPCERQKEAKRQRRAATAPSRDTPGVQEHNTFWDYVNGGKLNARHVRKARQLEVEHLDKMGVFERAPCKVARCNTRADRAHPGSMGGHIEEQRHPQELVGGKRVSQRIQKMKGLQTSRPLHHWTL